MGCTARAAGEAGFAVLSTNAGATFGPHKGNLLSTVPPDEYVAQISAATGQRLAVLVVDTSDRAPATSRCPTTPATTGP